MKMNKQKILEVICNGGSEEEMIEELTELIGTIEDVVCNAFDLLNEITIDNLGDVLSAKELLEKLKADLY